MSQEFEYQEESEEWNDDIESDVKVDKDEYDSIVIYSRDWTVETMVNQIKQGNIDLNPAFQRRNAWDDMKRSRLIESLILNLPVPEVILAENPNKRKSYIVIDGKQRLSTLVGYVEPKDYDYWKRPKLKKIKVDELEGKAFDALNSSDFDRDYQSELMNSAVRCTVVSNFKSIDTLYDIFYRLNTGSVPLSMQELRQVLNPGPFASYLLEKTNEDLILHDVLGNKGPDSRLRDAELLLRFIAMILFREKYHGNLKNFLDNSMTTINSDWDAYAEKVEVATDSLLKSLEKMALVFGSSNDIGKKTNEKTKRFNKVLFEVQAFFFTYVESTEITQETNKIFLEKFDLLLNDSAFSESISHSTKNMSMYQIRFEKFEKMINEVYGKSLSLNAFIEDEA